MTIIVGLDLSLTSTGVARISDDTPPDLCTIPTKSDLALGMRLELIKNGIWGTIHGADLVVVEDVVATSRNGATVAMVHGLIRWMLWRDSVPHTFIPPATLKVFATGRGNAGKDEMLASAIHRLGYQGHSHDVADALWLAHLGAHLLGRPAVDLPATHLRALLKVKAVAA